MWLGRCITWLVCIACWIWCTVARWVAMAETQIAMHAPAAAPPRVGGLSASSKPVYKLWGMRKWRTWDTARQAWRQVFARSNSPAHVSQAEHVPQFVPANDMDLYDKPVYELWALRKVWIWDPARQLWRQLSFRRDSPEYGRFGYMLRSFLC